MNNYNFLKHVGYYATLLAFGGVLSVNMTTAELSVWTVSMFIIATVAFGSAYLTKCETPSISGDNHGEKNE